MAQKAQVIDVTKSYIPGDPNAFPENLVNTSQEDGEEKTPAIMPFEGYNFLPTSYGYRSYFGTTSRLDIPQVPARVQFILSYQSDTFINNLIALCEDGIWIIDPTANTNTWKHVVVHTFSAEVFEEWTYCIIENTVYMYKQGKDFVYYTSNTDDVPNGLSISIPSFTPSFLNMSGQLGIFRAGTRLGFWDSANSIAWSSNLDLTDFTPSLENLAGNTIFGLVTGRVVHVREQGEGYVIYATKSIVGVSFSAEGNMLWDSHLISDVCGIAYGREVCFGVSNNEHYVHTSIGLHRIGSYNRLTKVHEFTPIATELSDILAEERNPIYLDCMGGRYIYIHAISDTYINGKVSFTSVTVDSLDIEAVFNLDPSLISRELFVKMIQNFERNSADSTYGDTLVKYTADGIPFDILEWEASYRAISPLGMYEKLVNPSLGASFAYQNASSLDRSSIGWSNRTSSSGTFVPPNGDYNSLDSGVPLVSYSDFLIRGDKNDDFSKPISKTLRFQTDAFTHEDNLGTYDLSYQLRKSCGTEPSFLEISGRASYGLLEGMYNVASHWKDYEKRQKLVIDNFTDIVSNLKPFQWDAYSVNGGLEAVIENPIYEIFDLFKPYGNVGVSPVGKGLFFYKNYREYYDCVVGAFREVSALNIYKETDNCIFSSPTPYLLEDKMDIDLTVTIPDPAFPNPSNYFLYVSEDNNGSWENNFRYYILYYLVDIVTGEASDYTTFDYPYLSLNKRLIVQIQTEAPGGYAYRLVVVYDQGYDTPVSRVYHYADYTAVGTYYINNFASMAELATYPPTNINTTDNTYIDAINVNEWSITLDSRQDTQLTFTLKDVWVSVGNYYNGAVSSPVFLGTINTFNGYNRTMILNGPIISTCYITVYIRDAEVPTSRMFSTVLYNNPSVPVFKYLDDIGNQVDFYYLSGLPDINREKVLTWAENGEPIINNYSTSLPFRAGSTTYIQDLISESQTSGISFEGLEDPVEFKDIEDQEQSAPYSTNGKIPLLMRDYNGTGNYQTLCTLTHRVSLPGDWNLEVGAGVAYKVERVTQELADAYPYLLQPKGEVVTVGTYRSFNEAIVRLAGYGDYLQLVMQMSTGPNGDKLFQPSKNISSYTTEFKNGKIEIECTIWNGQTSAYQRAVVLLMEQTAGFIYEYEVEEEPFGSMADNSTVDLGGSALIPTLDGEGVYNTIGAFFMPKNKISATLSAGTLTLGASSNIGEYEAKEAEILDFLTPSNNTFEASKYLLPPTYDSGERWYLVKAADKIYDSGGIFNYKTGTVAGIDNLFWNTIYYLDDFVPYDIPTDDTTIIQESLGVLPGSTFLIQEGNISASYPSFKGAHVFDLFLKKWGKMKEDYKIIFSYSALNSGNSGILPYSNFGMDCGVVLSSDSKISLFDIKPVDSWMRIGKIGYYRLGMTRAYEVKTMFRSPSSGKITLDTSLDGRTLEVALKTEQIFSNKVKVDMYPDISGRWHTIKIEGNYDLQYLEFRGTIAGRR